MTRVYVTTLKFLLLSAFIGLLLLAGNARKQMSEFKPLPNLSSTTDLPPKILKVFIDQSSFEIDSKTPIQQNGRFVSHFSNAVQDGLILFMIAPNGLLAHLSLSNGDVINKIDGHEVRTSEDLEELVKKLKITGTVSILILRHDEPFEIQCEVTSKPAT